MLQMLIWEARGSLRKLCVSGLHNGTTFSFFADHAASLQTLRIPRSDISDSIVEQIAGKLSTITFLDVSYCTKISGCALEAIGKHCKLLAGLCRNMHPLDTEGMETQDDEAHANATMMPKLKRLEMAYHLVSTEGLLQILSSSTEVEFMDLRGCWNVNLDDKFLRESLPKLTVLRPLVMTGKNFRMIPTMMIRESWRNLRGPMKQEMLNCSAGIHLHNFSFLSCQIVHFSCL